MLGVLLRKKKKRIFLFPIYVFLIILQTCSANWGGF